MQLDSYNDHAKSGCTTHTCQVSSDTSVNDVLQKPLTSPLMPVEQKLQTSLAWCSMSGSPEDVLQMKTGGRVSAYTHVSSIHEHNILHDWHTHTTTANDLCTGESGTSTIWKGRSMNNPEKVAFPGKCSSCCQCRWRHYPACTWNPHLRSRWEKEGDQMGWW